MYYRARYYQPRFQRFISEDPIGFGGGDTNLYGYVRGNPLNWRDPRGHFALVLPLVPPLVDAGIAVGGVIAGGIIGQIISNVINSKVPDLPSDLIGNNPKPSTGKRTNTDLPAERFPDVIDDLTGGNTEIDAKGNQVCPNGIRIRPESHGKGPRIDVPANGKKPTRNNSFPTRDGMAMVNSAIFLPAEDSLASLGRLHNHARVLRRRFESEVLNRTLNQVLIVADDGTAMRIDSDYGDVEFKFECFSLNVFPCTPDTWGDSDTVEICEFEGWYSVKCVFRFEYERPAAKGEVSETFVQVVRKAGKKQEVPKEATAIGCALVGIAFWNSVERCPVLLVANGDIDADDPTAIQVSKERVPIETFMNSCESVNLEDVPKWTAEVRRWLGSR